MPLHDWLKDYFTFSARDRAGILVLTFLILAVILLPAVWTDTHPPLVDAAETAEFMRMAKSLRATGDSAAGNANGNSEKANAVVPPSNYTDRLSVPAPRLFDFDPNTLPPEKWLELGVREKTVSTIRHYLAKGGKFKKPGDLEKVYGLSAAQVTILLPHVKIANQLSIPPSGRETPWPGSVHPRATGFSTGKSLSPIDINAADTTAWMALPGIGTRLAARIVAFRTRLGGFYTASQVGETYGVPDSVYLKILPMLRCLPGAVQQINVNTADAATLRQHPYIRWALANAIVQYRSQHGSFKNLEELLGIALITPELLEKLKPYLSAG
jgi:competence protein ComEA